MIETAFGDAINILNGATCDDASSSSSDSDGDAPSTGSGSGDEASSMNSGSGDGASSNRSDSGDHASSTGSGSGEDAWSTSTGTCSEARIVRHRAEAAWMTRRPLSTASIFYKGTAWMKLLAAPNPQHG